MYDFPLLYQIHHFLEEDHMKRILSIILCLALVLGALPAVSFADDILPEGLYWRGTAREPDEETGFKIFADPDMPLSADPITGYPGEQTGCIQVVYSDGAGNETPLTCADLTFTERDTYYQANDPVAMFVREGEILVDIVRMSTGNTGKIKYTKDENEFSLSIISVLPDFGIYSGMEGYEEDILFSWDYDGTNDTIYFVAKDGLYLNNAWIDAEEAEWMGLEVGMPVDHKAVALTITDIDSFRGGFDLHYSWTDDPAGSGELHEDEIYIFLFDMRPLIFRWVDEHDGIFEVQDNEDRTMWASPGEEKRVQFSYMNEDGSFTVLPLDDLEFEGCTADYATDWDGNIVDASYVVLSFDDFGEASVTYETAGGRSAVLPIHIGLPDFGYYSIARPTAEAGTEDWNDELRAAYMKEWAFDANHAVLYIRGVYNSSLAWVTNVEQESDHDVEWEILENGKLIKVTMNEPAPWQDWLNLRITCERRDDEGNVLFSGEEHWANIRVRDARPRLVFKWVDLHWDDTLHETVYELHDWEESNTELWSAPGDEPLIAFFVKDDQGTLTQKNFSDLVFAGSCYEAEEEGEGYVRMQFLDWGSGTISLKDNAYAGYLPVYITSDLPPYGYYSIERPTVPETDEEGWNGQLMDAYVSEWVFEGTPSTLWIRGTYNQSFAWITSVEQESDHDIDIDILEEGKLVKVTLNEPHPDQDWLNLRILSERRDDEGNVIFSGEENWANIRIVDKAPRLVAFWADSEWDEGAEADRYTVRDWENPLTDLFGQPGNGWFVSFFFRDGEGDLTPVRAEDLTWDESLVVLIVQGDAENLDAECATVIALDFGESDIVYTKDGTNYSFKVNVDLPGYGFYDIESPTVDQFIGDPDEPEPNPEWNAQLKAHYQGRWDYTGTNKTLYVRGAYNESLAYIVDVINHSDHDVTCTISADERSVAITMNEPGYSTYLNLELVVERRGEDGTVIFGPYSENTEIWVRNLQPGLVWRWADCGDWIGAEDRPELFEREDAGIERGLTMSPGDEWWIQFFLMDENEDLTYAESLTFDDSMVELQKYTVEGKVFYRVRCLDFGESEIAAGENKMRMEGVLPQVGFYSKPQATEANYLRGEWTYDGTDDTKTIYYVAADGWALKDISRTGGVRADIDFDQSTGVAAITMTAPVDDHLDIRMIFAQLDGDGDEVWESGWRDDGIRIRDTRPVLIGEQWSYYAEDDETEPSWHQREVWPEGEAGRWAGFVHHLRFRGPDGYITSGIESSDEGIVTLSYNSEDEIWETDIHGYGQALLTWIDPSSGETYTFRIHASEPDGFYMDPDPYLDTYLYYDSDADAYLVEYTKGEGCTIYLRDFGYYEKGIKSVEVLSGSVTASVKSLDMAEISVSKTARYDFDAVIRITYELFDGDEGPDSEEVTISFHAAGTAKRKLRSQDGLVEAVVDKDSGTASFSGDLADTERILLASYDENGRFLGLKIVSQSGDTASAEDGADNVSIFWIDGEYAPRSEKATVDLTE